MHRSCTCGAWSGNQTALRIGWAAASRPAKQAGSVPVIEVSHWQPLAELTDIRPVSALCTQGSSKQNDSVADMVLTGHTDIAEFAEGISNAAPLVASGGRDTNVSRPSRLS